MHVEQLCHCHHVWKMSAARERERQIWVFVWSEMSKIWTPFDSSKTVHRQRNLSRRHRSTAILRSITLTAAAAHTINHMPVGPSVCVCRGDVSEGACGKSEMFSLYLYATRMEPINHGIFSGKPSENCTFIVRASDTAIITIEMCAVLFCVKAMAMVASILSHFHVLPQRKIVTLTKRRLPTSPNAERKTNVLILFSISINMYEMR